MASPHILCFLCLLFATTFTSSSSISTPNTITLPLSPLFTKHPSSDLLQTLKHLASASLTRAHHLKHRKSQLNSPTVKTQVHPKSYGGYSIDLKFGTPSQTFPLVLDTGSSLVWLPCSSRYLCSNCNSFPNTTKIPTFIPKNSSSSKFIGCKNPKCAWVFGPNVQSKCQDCKPYAKNCSQTCPAYTIQYGMGSTAGFLLSENLNFPGKIVPDFLFGCSLVSIYQPAGIAGFGRGPESLPSQMGLKRFSYCLVSHRFDDTPESSELVLQGGSSSEAAKTGGLSYTPFKKNPSTRNPAFSTYYYVSIWKILIGGKTVRIMSRILEPDSNGNGGSIVDSGSTFTFMERPVFDSVAQEFEKQVNYTRAREVEKQSGMSPCYNVHGDKTASFPELAFQFRGGAKMTLPLTNYFSFVGKSGVACLTILSDDVGGPALAGGPAIILGNYQQQNFYVEYDLVNERFGFRNQNCKRSV